MLIRTNGFCGETDRRASRPTQLQSNYGYMNWYLNTSRKKQFPGAPESSIFFLWAGTNMIWMDRDYEIVVVVRWLAKVDDFIQQVMAALATER